MATCDHSDVLMLYSFFGGGRVGLMSVLVFCCCCCCKLLMVFCCSSSRTPLKMRRFLSMGLSYSIKFSLLSRGQFNPSIFNGMSRPLQFSEVADIRFLSNPLLPWWQECQHVRDEKISVIQLHVGNVYTAVKYFVVLHLWPGQKYMCMSHFAVFYTLFICLISVEFLLLALHVVFWLSGLLWF